MMFPQEAKEFLSCQTVKVSAAGQKNPAPDAVPASHLSFSFLTTLPLVCHSMDPFAWPPGNITFYN